MARENTAISININEDVEKQKKPWEN